MEIKLNTKKLEGVVKKVADGWETLPSSVLNTAECYFMKYPKELEKFLDHILAEEVGYDQY